MKGTYKALRITNSEEALQLLLKSKRVYEDLISIEPLMPYDITNYIVLREWSPELIDHPEMEFRGFVYSNQFNALTQYDYLSYHKKVIDNKDLLEKQIKDFWHTIRGDLSSHQAYIIDFFVASDGVKIVELNSFEAWTGACLFTWHEHSDILKNGPFTFAVVEEQPQEDLLELLPPTWRKYIIDCLQIKE